MMLKQVFVACFSYLIFNFVINLGCCAPTTNSHRSSSAAAAVSKTLNYGNRRLNEWTFLVSHNSILNWEDNSVIFHASNQNSSISDQLKNGVRGFMLDVDMKECSFFQNLLGTCDCQGMCLCHGQCGEASMAIKNGFNVKPLVYALRKLVAFLLKNPEEIVILFLEDYVTDVKTLQNEFNKVKSFNDLVFNPYAKEWNVLNNGWPKISDMVKANKRLLIFDDEQRGSHAKAPPGIIRKFDYLIENHFEWVNNVYVWNETNWPSSRIYEQVRDQIQNDTQLLTLAISSCVSVESDEEGSPRWSLQNPIRDLQLRERPQRVKNGDKLFLFNHFYGVPAQQSKVNPVTLRIMNTRELIYKRLDEYCGPATANKRPNFIALDFIGPDTYTEIIEPLNKRSDYN